MHKLCRFDITRSREIYQNLISFVCEIKAKLPVTEVYLYGSLVDGEVNEGSDIDLLIIGDFKESFFKRILTILSFTELPIEPLVYTQDEFNEMKKNRNPFILEILKRGKEF